MTDARVLLASLAIRTSAKGRPYLSGWLGRSKLVGFPGKVDKFGNETWDLFVQAIEEREAREADRPVASHPVDLPGF